MNFKDLRLFIRYILEEKKRDEPSLSAEDEEDEELLDELEIQGQSIPPFPTPPLNSAGPSYHG